MCVHSQEHPFGVHIYTQSKFCINPDMCVETIVRTLLCPFFAYATFIHEAPGVAREPLFPDHFLHLHFFYFGKHFHTKRLTVEENNKTFIIS